MISFTEASISNISVHKAGNKSRDEGMQLSENILEIKDDVLAGILMQYFLSPLQKINEVYHFAHHSGDISLNEMCHFSKQLFDDATKFHEVSKQVVTHLYNTSEHPNIKQGEVYVVAFKNVQLEGRLYDAMGIFKSENKETFLTIATKGKGFDIGYEQEAISIKKLDKGCLILNTGEPAEYTIVVTDQTNRYAESVYWVDNFLQLKIRNDRYQQTQQVLNIYKDFVTKQMEEEFNISKPEKIDLLNRSISYFKQNEKFSLDEFSEAVIGNPDGIASFKSYKKNYEEEFDTRIEDAFDISGAAVKKQSRYFKSVLKLDRNFHIYIHGSNEWIEKGFDATVGKNYYKIYFNEES